MEVRAVDTLPTLNPAQYGDLPEVPDGTVLVLANTPWRKMEVELVAAVVIQACMTTGQWQPVASGPLFEELYRHLSIRFVHDAYEIGIAVLVEQGDIEVVEFEDDEYAIPMPSLSSKALGSGGQIRYASLRSEQPTEPIRFTPTRSDQSFVRKVLNRFGITRS